ncbi:MAG: fructose-6-phosphate aldolase [Candidatus Firestonebacteria bacterium]
MKIFLDSANISEIKEMNEFNLIDGVTTNPTLLAKEGKNFMKTLREISKIVNGPIHVEPIGTSINDMLKEAEVFSKISENIIIKIPFIKEGIKAVNVLSKRGIKTNFTLIFSANQAILAAKVGVDYITPFVGRLDDETQSGTNLIRDIVKIYKNYDFRTQVLAASVRTPLHVLEVALAGTNIVTVPKSVLELMIKHPLTDLGVKKFIEDWKKK